MRKLKRSLALTTAILIHCLQTYSQHIGDTSKQYPSLELNALYGFFIANQPKSLYLRNDHSAMIELAVSMQTTGKRNWERQSNFPRVGIGVLHGNLGSDEYLGNITAVYPFLHFPLIRQKKSVTSFRLGAGAGWVQKPYDRENNYKNLMISTHVNAVISLRVQTEWELSRNLFLNAGLAFTHLSNGGFRLPNLGLNIPAISAGLRYGPSFKKPAETKTTSSFSKRSGLLIQGAFALKQTYPLESQVKPVEIINVELIRDLSAVSRVAAGVTFCYDHSLSKEVYNAPTYIFENDELKFQTSVYAGYEHVVGRLSIPVQLGTYLYNNYKISQFYQMIGLRYRFADKWFASLQLKAHFGKADYIQYGLGYRIF